MCRVLPKLGVNKYNVRLGYIHVPVGFKCEASIPKGEIGFLEGFKHRASHSFQYLAEYTHTSEAGVYTYRVASYK